MLLSRPQVIVIGVIVFLSLFYAYFALTTPSKYPVYIDDIQIRYNDKITKTIDFNDRSLNEITTLSDSQNLLQIVDTEYHSPLYSLAFENAYNDRGEASLKLEPEPDWRSFEVSWYIYIWGYGSTGTSSPIFWAFFSGASDLAFNMHVNFAWNGKTSEPMFMIYTMYYNYTQQTPLTMTETISSTHWKLGEWQKVSILFDKDRSTLKLKIDDEIVFEDAWKPEYVDQPQELRWIS